MRNITLFITLVAFYLSPAQTTVSKTIRQFGARGDGRTNDHQAFLDAASFFNKRGGRGKLIIPKGTYIVGRQGQLANGSKDNHVLEFLNCRDLNIEGDNAVIKFASGLKFGSFDPSTGKPFHSPQAVFTDYTYAMPIGNFIQLVNCTNTSVKNIEVDGNSQNFILGGKYGDVGFQLAHDGLLIKNSSSIVIQNIYVHHMGRDGVQLSNITPQEWQTADQKIVFKNCRFEYNGRQGFSWVGGSGLKMDNCKLSFTGRGKVSSPPGAGLDVEGEVGIIKNGNFSNCEFIDNTGSGIVADGGSSRGMNFEDCLLWGTTNWTVWTTKPQYHFNKCTFHGSIVHGYNSPDDENATVYDKCTFEDKDYKGRKSYGAFLAEINSVKRVRFTECKFVANEKKLLWIVSDDAYRLEEMPMLEKCKFILKNKNLKYPDYWLKYYKVRLKDDEWYIPTELKNTDTYFVAGGENILQGTNIWHYSDTDRKIVNKEK